MKKIYGENVLVTGASSGIGREIATLFARNGYTVYAVSRSIEEKDERIGSGRIISLRADVTDENSLLSLKGKIDRLSIIIHAAGFGIAGSAEEMDIALAKKQLDVNYFGPMMVNQVFLPMLRENERSLVIFISSIAGRVPIPYQSHYSSSKYALEAYSEALGMEGRKHGVHTVLLEPGDTKTDFTAKRKTYISENSVYKDDAFKAIRKMERDERSGKNPMTVAKAALKVASMRRPPVRKPIGLEYSALMLLLRLLPQRAVEKILTLLY